MILDMGNFSKRTTSPKPTPTGQALTFSEPNQSELNWLAAHLQVASEMGVNVDDLDQIVSLYDGLRESWSESPGASPSDPNSSVNVIGIALGEHLTRQTPLRWIVATDSLGTELALHDSDTELLIYPANMVAKRWTTNESGSFVVGIRDEMIRHLGPHT